jgi:anthranilate/para-aminobenzoate synthase component I
MKEIEVLDALASLSHLDGSLMVGADRGGGYVAYLDFAETLTLDSINSSEQIGKLAETVSPSGLSFSGWVGFFGYEFLAKHAGVQLRANRDISVPEGFFGRPQTILRLRESLLSIESTLPDREDQLAASLADPVVPKPLANPVEIICNLSFEDYEKVFATAREAILDGETYQIKISQRHEARISIDPIDAFRRLHAANPSPEAFLIRQPDFAIVSCSPETVIDKTGEKIVTRPIGGTHERRSGIGDREAIARFLGDPKEVTEHNMLVDLERNDLSAVCESGSVRIARFREVETYAHLFHLVSTIEGRLRSDCDLAGILRSMLPGGTITGCPKIRTIEIIDSLEPCFRGPYTGSFGTIGDDGSIRLNLIIRALLILEDRCFAQAGGGIVVNSSPEYEYNENGVKARALLDLLR